MRMTNREISSEVALSTSERTLYPYPDLLGFIFHLSWMYLFLYLDKPVGFIGPLEETIGPQPWLYVISACFVVLTLTLFALRPRLVDVCERSLPCRVDFPSLIAAGSALFYTSMAIAPDNMFAIDLVSGATTGIGSGILAARWAKSYGLIGMKRIMEIIPTLLVGVTALCVTLPLLPDPISIACVISFPILSGVFCTRSHRALVASEDDQPSAISEFNAGTILSRGLSKTPATPHERRSYMIAVGVVAILGTALGLLNSIQDPSLSTEYLIVFYAIAVMALLVACSVYLFRQKRQSFALEFGLPTITLCFFVVLLVNTQSNSFFSALQSLGSICLELLFFVSLVCWADYFSLSAVRTFALGRITYAITNYLASMIAQSIPWASGSEMLIQANSFALFAGAEIIAVAAVLIIFLTRRHPHGEEKTLSPEHETSQNIMDKADKEIFSDETTALDSPTQAMQPRFRERLGQFANTFGLTARETDVAAELIKGRGYAHIADELSISEGTVNYHIRNIYAKTLVHTREDLIDLFDDFEAQ